MISIKSQPSWDSVKKRWNDIPPKLTKNFNQIFASAGFIVEGEAKRITPVDTGRLRASIYTTVSSKQAVIQPNVDYAIYVHEGTSRMKARRFMLEGAEKSLPKIRELGITVIRNSFK